MIPAYQDMVQFMRDHDSIGLDSNLFEKLLPILSPLITLDIESKYFSLNSSLFISLYITENILVFIQLGKIKI